MLVDALGMTNHRVEIEDIQDFIAATYDKEAKMTITTLKLCSYGEELKEEV